MFSLLSILFDLLNLATLAEILTKHWRVTVALSAGILIDVAVRFGTDSDALRAWIGFPVILTLIALGLVWDAAAVKRP